MRDGACPAIVLLYARSPISVGSLPKQLPNPEPRPGGRANHNDSCNAGHAPPRTVTEKAFLSFFYHFSDWHTNLHETITTPITHILPQLPNSDHNRQYYNSRSIFELTNLKTKKKPIHQT